MSDESNGGFFGLCWVGNYEEVETAIARGADVNETNTSGETGLMMALQRRRKKVARLLLQLPKIDINKVDHHGVCALHHVVLNDNSEGLALLLAREDLTSLNERNRWKETPLMHTLACNAVDCFRLLLCDPRLDLDVRDGHQRSLEEVQRWLSFFHVEYNCGSTIV